MFWSLFFGHREHLSDMFSTVPIFHPYKYDVLPISGNIAKATNKPRNCSASVVQDCEVKGRCPLPFLHRYIPPFILSLHIITLMT